MTSYVDQNTISLIRIALFEDLGLKHEDVTTSACIAGELNASAIIIAKQDAIIFGHEVAREVFSQLDKGINYQIRIPDGSIARDTEIIAEIRGPLKGILIGERTALNFIQRLSAVATTTKSVISAINPFKTEILDSRKTTPGFRVLEKAAVHAGGGVNHRMGLYDEFLIKNNHIDALNGNVVKAIEKCRSYNSKLKLKVEVRDQVEIKLALSAMPDGLLLDNFKPEELKKSVAAIKADSRYKNILLESSGGINLGNVYEYAATGVDQLSLGFLTHSAKSVDISLRYDKQSCC